MSTLTARDVMSPAILAVRPEMTLPEVAAFLVDHAISGAPVRDAAGTLLGIVSLHDVAVAARAGRAAPQDEADPHAWEWPGVAASTTARDLMTRAVIGVSEETPVEVVARLMLEHRVHRVLVTRRGRPCGIVSTMDLLALLSRRGGRDGRLALPLAGGAREAFVAN
jgi:CBS domain-containing protein